MEGFSAYRCPSRADRTRVLSVDPFVMCVETADDIRSLQGTAIHKNTMKSLNRCHCLTRNKPARLSERSNHRRVGRELDFCGEEWISPQSPSCTLIYPDCLPYLKIPLSPTCQAQRRPAFCHVVADNVSLTRWRR